MGKRSAVTLLLFTVVLTSSIFLPRAFPSPGGAASPVVAPVAKLAAPTGQYFDYIVIILMENHNLCDIYTHCGGSGTYETSLADTYGIPLNDHYCNVNPSLPNYLCLTGGSSFGCSGYDGGPNSNPCTATAWNSPNVVDRLVSGGLTWKAYMENMPSNCYGSDSGSYAVRHDPFVYYHDIVGNASRCSRVVPAGTSDGTFLGDLGSTSTASNYMWLTPNTCNDMHDCSIATGDSYLANLVPQVLNSTVFQTQKAAIFLVFDEGYSHPTFAAWAGPVVKRGYTSSVTYTHFSLLSTIEANWNLPYLNATNDGAAANMSEFFTSSAPGSPVARFTFSPTWPQVNATVTFDASSSSDPNPNATLQYRWDWTNDGTWDTGWSSNAVATHAFPSAGSYTTHLEVQDNLGQTGNATNAVVVDSEAPTTSSALTGTVGNNGWYRSSVSVKLTASDDLSGVASTRYRKDNGSWATYSNPFTVGGDGSHSVDFYSVDNAGNTEAAHTLYLAIDATPPASTATLHGTLNGSVYVGSVNVSLSATDVTSGVASTQYELDGGSWTPYASPVTVGGNGTHTVAYRSTDGAGNVENAKNVSFSIGPSSGDPVTAMDVTGTPGDGSWYVSPVVITLSATDPGGLPTTIHYRLDGGPWSLYGSSLTLSDGVHELDYNATDSASNQEPTQVRTIQIDTHPPQTNVALAGTHGRDHWFVSAVTVTLTATDATSGVASNQYQIDGGPWQPYTASFSIGRGRHTLAYLSSDVAGLWGAQGSVQVKVDSTAPTLTVSSVPAFQTTSEVILTWTETDDLAGVLETDLSLDGSPFISLGLNTTGRLSLPDGAHVIALRAIDDAGNEAWANLTLRVDTNLFSPTGPLHGMPTYVILVIVVGGLVFGGLHRRARKRRARRERALARMRARTSRYP